MGHQDKILIEVYEELSGLVPADIQAIREFVLSDVNFRSICEDYVEASRALKHWEAQNLGKQSRAEEFRRIADDLRTEAIEYFQIASHN